MTDELVDIIDKADRVVGKATKSVVHAQGLPHRVGAVLLQRQDGRYLVPTASERKPEAGGLYHSAGGHALSGESYADCARRELLEEAGIEVNDMQYLGVFWFERDYPTRKERERFEVYRAIYSEDSGPIRLNEEQLDEKWLSVEELRGIYTTKRELISLPLRMTCKAILNLNGEERENQS